MTDSVKPAGGRGCRLASALAAVIAGDRSRATSWQYGQVCSCSSRWSPPRTAYVDAGLRSPEEILGQAPRTLDFIQPAALLLVGIFT
jgi:hypothetical protein